MDCYIYESQQSMPVCIPSAAQQLLRSAEGIAILAICKYQPCDPLWETGLALVVCAIAVAFTKPMTMAKSPTQTQNVSCGGRASRSQASARRPWWRTPSTKPSGGHGLPPTVASSSTISGVQLLMRP